MHAKSICAKACCATWETRRAAREYLKITLEPENAMRRMTKGISEECKAQATSPLEIQSKSANGAYLIFLFTSEPRARLGLKGSARGSRIHFHFDLRRRSRRLTQLTTISRCAHLASKYPLTPLTCVITSTAACGRDSASGRLRHPIPCLVRLKTHFNATFAARFSLTAHLRVYF